ncbi:hypothetical protein DV735_g1122, partial [Chaetothyriales sp. CBS 134920]
MKTSSIVLGLGAAWVANALTIISPSSDITQVPIWPETLLEWTWAVGDPETVDIVIQYSYPNDTAVHALTWKTDVSATVGSISVAWVPLGLGVGTEVQLGLTEVGDNEATYDHTDSFTLVKAASADSTAQAASSTQAVSSTQTAQTASAIAPLVTGISVRPIDGNISATFFTTLSSTSTVTVITDAGTSTATMTSINTINTSVSSKSSLATSSSPPASGVGVDQVTTVHKIISTTTRTILLTEHLAAPVLDTASALASAGITAPVSAGSQSTGDVQAPSTVYVSVTVTENGANLTTTASFIPQSGAANSMHVMAKAPTTPTTAAYLTALTLLVCLTSGVIIGGGLSI